MLMYLDFFQKDISVYLNPPFKESLKDPKLRKICPLLDIMIVWALFKCGENQKSDDFYHELDGISKEISRALLLDLNNSFEAQRIVRENRHNLHILGGSIEQIEVITDCLRITRQDIFNNILVRNL